MKNKFRSNKTLIIVLIIGLTMFNSCKSSTSKNDEKKRPNIILILTDQQNATMLSCAGNKWLKTPAMDYIAKNGIRFTRAYCSNPVCSPSRVSMMTGRFPGIFNDDKGMQVRENAGSMKIEEISDEVKQTTISTFLKKAGYELIFGGKQHLPKPLSATQLGFRVISNNEREILAETAANEIKTAHNKPYFMIVSFINPHDICYMALRHFASSSEAKGIVEHGIVECATLDKALLKPKGIDDEEFFAEYCPLLPPNFEPQKGEPKAISSLLNRRAFRENAREHFTENDWRMHRWAYCRLTEFADNEIETVLNALKESGQEDNTLVIFSSDHGDMNAAHKMEHKTALYEEAANIPFIAMWKGHIPEGQIDSVHLISNGLDLLPTICDYAGIEGISDKRGKSLRPLFEGNNVEWRKTLGVESEIGRMIVTEDKLKYIKYDEAGIEEQLLDLKTDPFETTHFTKNTKYKNRLSELRNTFESEWFPGY